MAIVDENKEAEQKEILSKINTTEDWASADFDAQHAAWK